VSRSCVGPREPADACTTQATRYDVRGTSLLDQMELRLKEVAAATTVDEFEAETAAARRLMSPASLEHIKQ
jgi:hypothetical protein